MKNTALCTIFVALSPAHALLSATPRTMSSRTDLRQRAVGIPANTEFLSADGNSPTGAALRVQANLAHDLQQLLQKKQQSTTTAFPYVERKQVAEPSTSKAEVTEMERVTALGGVVNLALCLVKVIAGIISGSAAMVADAAHSLSDLLSDVVTWGAVKFGSRRPTKAMPYGYGKYEPLGALLVAGMLTLGATTVFTHSLHALLALKASAATGAMGVGGFGGWRGLVAMGAAAISIGSKEWIARATEKVGERFRSLPLKVNAAHHRSDALSSIVALVGTGGAVMGLPWLDPLSGLVVAGFVGKMAFEVGHESLGMLLDARDDECMEPVAACLDKIARCPLLRVVGFSDVRARRMGNKWDVDMWMTLHNGVSMSEALRIASDVRSQLRTEVCGVNDVAVQLKVTEAHTHTERGRARGDSSPNSIANPPPMGPPSPPMVHTGLFGI